MLPRRRRVRLARISRPLRREPCDDVRHILARHRSAGNHNRASPAARGSGRPAITVARSPWSLTSARYNPSTTELPFSSALAARTVARDAEGLECRFAASRFAGGVGAIGWRRGAAERVRPAPAAADLANEHVDLIAGEAFRPPRARTPASPSRARRSTSRAGSSRRLRWRGTPGSRARARRRLCLRGHDSRNSCGGRARRNP